MGCERMGSSSGLFAAGWTGAVADGVGGAFGWEAPGPEWATLPQPAASTASNAKPPADRFRENMTCPCHSRLFGRTRGRRTYTVRYAQQPPWVRCGGKFGAALRSGRAMAAGTVSPGWGPRCAEETRG